MMLLKCCPQHVSKFGKLSCSHWTRSVFIPIPKKGNAQECSNYCTFALILHASKVMLKILQAMIQQYVNWELSDVRAGLRKDRGTRDQIVNIHWIVEKARKFQKNIYFCSLTMLKPLCGSQNTGKFLEMAIPDHLTSLLRNLHASQEATVRTEHGTVTDLKLGKEYVTEVYCHPTYLTYIQSTLY